MSPTERFIAQTAIDTGEAESYEAIEQRVSNITGLQIASVHKILNQLAREGIVKRCAAVNPGRTRVHTLFDSRSAWYEKGLSWPE